MYEFLAGIALIGFVVAAWCVGIAAWFAALVYGFKAIRRTRPGVGLWDRDTRWNPANVLLRPSLLTEERRAYRRKCFAAVGIFTVCVGIPLLIAAVTGTLQ